MTLHSLVKELIFRDSEVIKQVFLHFYNQIWQSPLSLVEISFTILCQPPGKETLYSERHSISFERITQPFLISGDQPFLLSARNHCLRSLPMQRESPEIRTHRISCITQLHYCLIIFQRSWRIQLQEEWQTAEELKVIPRQMSLESPILHRRFAQYKSLTAGCKYVQVCVVCSLPSLDRQWGGDAQRTRTKLFHILICH